MNKFRHPVCALVSPAVAEVSNRDSTAAPFEPVSMRARGVTRWLRNCLSVLATLAAGAMAGNADATIVFVTEDTMISSTSPAESRVGWSYVQPSASQAALMSFPIREALPAGATADSLERVVLVINIVNIVTPGSLEVVRVLGTFTEAANPTFATRPAIAAAGTGIVFALDKGKTRPYYVDVTDLAKQALSANAQTFAIAIQPAQTPPSASAEIWSRESGTVLPWTPAIRPILDVTTVSKSVASQYMWVPSEGEYSCTAMCQQSGWVAAATSSGAVCKDASGVEKSTEFRVATNPTSMVVYYHHECGTSNRYDRTAQCSCTKK